MKVNMKINEERDKFFKVEVDKLKLLLKADTLFLIETFFLEGFPFYDPNSKDLPNLFDSDEENNPSMEIETIITHPLICLLSDNSNNLKQEMYCIDSQVSFVMKKEKISLIKEELKNEKEDIDNNTDNEKKNKNKVKNIWLMGMKINNISPFICSLEDVLKSEILQISQRKLTNDFNLSFSMKTDLKYENDLTFIKEEYTEVTLSYIITNMSLSDITIFMGTSTYIGSLLGNDLFQKLNELKYSSNKRIEWEKQNENNNINNKELKEKTKESKSKTKDANETIYYLNMEGIDIFFIDNQMNSFMPFFNMKSDELLITYIFPKMGEQSAEITFSFMIYVYNYIVGIWEPVIEKNKGLIKYKSFSSKNVTNNYIEIKFDEKALNINICDLHISLLYHIFYRWENLLNIKDNNNNVLTPKNSFEESKIVETNNKEKKMKISNHILFNYTGKTVEVFDIESGYLKINRVEVPNNYYYEINYPEPDISSNQNNKSSLSTTYNKNKVIQFYFNDARIGDNEIKIDKIKQKKHQITMHTNSKVKSNLLNYCYIISKVEFYNKKKAVYLFSPLCFRNKTQYNIDVIITEEDKVIQQQQMKSKKIIGISFQNFNGYIEFNINNYSIHRKIPIIQFLTSKEIYKPLQYGDIYVYLYSQKSENSYYKIIEIRNRYVLRNCLPFDIYFSIKEKKNKIPLLKSQKCECDMINPDSNFEIILNFLTFSTKNYVTLYNNKSGEQLSKIKLIDDSGYKVDILCTIYLDKKKKVTAILHPNSVLIDHSGLNCYFYYGKEIKKQNLIPGKGSFGNIWLLKYDQNILNMKCNEYQLEFLGKPFNVEAVGTANSIECVNKKENRFIEFIVQNNIFLLATDLTLYCNIINIYPKYILSNGLNENILIIDNKNSYITLNSKNNCAFDFFGYGENYPFYLLICDKEEKWEKSSQIYLNDCKFQTIVLNSVDKSKKRFINFSKKMEGVITYIFIENSTFEKARVTIENYSSVISLNVYQYKYPNYPNYVDCLNRSIFVWPNIKENNIIKINFGIGRLNKRPIMITHNKLYELFNEYICLYYNNQRFMNKYPYNEVIKIHENQNVGYKIRLIIINNGISFKIRVYDEIINNIENKIGNTEINIYFKQIGISLIGDNTFITCKNNFSEYDRNELIFLSIDDFEIDYIQNKEDDIITNNISLKIKDLEIDNQLTILEQFLIVLKQNDKNSKFIQFDFETEENIIDKTFEIHLISLKINAFILKLESTLLTYMFKFTNNITLGLQTSITNVHPIFLSFLDSFKKNYIIKSNYIEPLWKKNIKNYSEESPIYIHQLGISSIYFHLRLLNQEKDIFYENLLENNPLIKKLSKLYDNIDTTISLEDNQLMNIYGTSNNLMSIIINSYKQQLILQFITVGLNLELFGQPVNLIKSVGTGFKDLIKKSNEGITGFLDGTLSLFKNSANGTLNSVSQMSSGVSSTLLKILNDKEYLNKRQFKKMTEKPNDFMEGFGYGITAMAGGIFYGITDIVRKPIEGIKQEKNLSGFGKGILKGIGGVITKPISGVIDLVSKTSEGIKNTIKKNDESFQRVRLPLPLYGKYKFYKEYNKREAELYYFIKKFFKEDFKIRNFISYYNTQDKVMLLVFDNYKVYLIDYEGKEILVNIDLKDISDVKKESFNVKIFFKRIIKERKSSTIKISKVKHSNDHQAHNIWVMFKDILEIDDMKFI